MALPGMTKPKKPQSPKGHQVVEAYLNGDTSKKPNFTDIATWWSYEYTQYYGEKCIDFNVFDAQKVFKSLYSSMGMTLDRFLVELKKWFKLYDTLGYSEGDFKNITMYTLKHCPYIVKGLTSRTPRKRKRSDYYLKNGVSTQRSRANKSRKSIIVKEKF